MPCSDSSVDPCLHYGRHRRTVDRLHYRCQQLPELPVREPLHTHYVRASDSPDTEQVLAATVRWTTAKTMRPARWACHRAPYTGMDADQLIDQALQALRGTDPADYLSPEAVCAYRALLSGPPGGETER